MEGQKFTWFPQFTDMLAELAKTPVMGFETGVTENKTPVFKVFPVVELMLAITEYGTYGKEPEFSNPLLKAAFLGVKSDIDCSINARGKNKGGRPKSSVSPGKTPVSVGLKPRETPVMEFENPSEKTETPPINNKTIQSNKEKGEKEKPFALRCLMALNKELRGCCNEFTIIPPSNAEYIASLEGTVTEGDVARMVRFKRSQWEGSDFKRNLNPKTLFSPEHFEQYLNESQQSEVVDNELQSYGERGTDLVC